MKDVKLFLKIFYVFFLVSVPIMTYLANQPIRDYNEKQKNYSIEMTQQYCPYCGNELKDGIKVDEIEKAYHLGKADGKDYVIDDIISQISYSCDDDEEISVKNFKAFLEKFKKVTY